MCVCKVCCCWICCWRSGCVVVGMNCIPWDKKKRIVLLLSLLLHDFWKTIISLTFKLGELPAWLNGVFDSVWRQQWLLWRTRTYVNEMRLLELLKVLRCVINGCWLTQLPGLSGVSSKGKFVGLHKNLPLSLIKIWEFFWCQSRVAAAVCGMWRLLCGGRKGAENSAGIHGNLWLSCLWKGLLLLDINVIKGFALLP